jgi:hypothetical protein
MQDPTQNPTNIALKIQNALDDLPMTVSKRNEINGCVMILHKGATEADQLRQRVNELQQVVKETKSKVDNLKGN